MHWAALFAGIFAGGVNFALLALGGTRFLRGKKRAGLALLLSGPVLPVLGLLVCAAVASTLLPWFGLAAGAALVLPAIVYFFGAQKHMKGVN